MGFLAGGISFTRFRVTDPVSDDFLRNVPDLLRKFAFKDIDDIPEVRSFGWVPWQDPLDIEWHNFSPHLGEYLVFSLRLDTRRIPPAVIKKHVELAIRKEKDKYPDGKQFLSRTRKKEIRENVTQKLLQSFLPIPAFFPVLWMVTRQQLLFSSVQGKMIDLFMEYFTSTFELHLEQLAPVALAETFLDENSCQQLERIEEANFI